MQVRATAVGFDGLCVRSPDGDPFEMPDDVFDVHVAEHKKRQRLYDKAIDTWNGSAPLPANPGSHPEPLWFEPVKKVRDGEDLV